MNVQHHQFAATPTRTYHFVTAGQSGHPAWLLLHGFTGSHHDWWPTAETLASKYYCIMPDLPGHGQSFHTGTVDDMALPTTARDLWRLLKHLGVSDVGILGYSMGGRLALHLPLYGGGARVRSLILESTTAGLRSREERALRRQADEQLARHIEERGIKWFADYWGTLPLLRTDDPALAAQQYEERLGNNPVGLASSLRAAGTGHQASLWSILPSYHMPVLLIAGAHDQKFQALAESLHTALPNSQVHLIPHAGHTVHKQAPGAFHQALRTWVDRSEATI
ncbi:2-succinyl-6-hydroxy-2,4-cyclohexadiene-1-carboxylate synthase [Sulfobacillus thermotolerans]|uniref:Putative 2-succinyl-6-hydroxy-2,4-cyclohexadiene-1-carboxylate synthase n=1 Tax=Sulfobacillus thermotolerans TaxID=338644 RepID=A0ABM6RS69_9FIRM|nr:2-succinyl-6-hydroxy-2,4-cyclohexadiene-1-carboxylate synthase [Sulfobacillus thermotolerans]